MAKSKPTLVALRSPSVRDGIRRGIAVFSDGREYDYHEYNQVVHLHRVDPPHRHTNAPLLEAAVLEALKLQDGADLVAAALEQAPGMASVKVRQVDAQWLLDERQRLRRVMQSALEYVEGKAWATAAAILNKGITSVKPQEGD